MMLMFLLFSLGLLVCNAVYCVLKIVTDFKCSQQAAGVWGLVALAGTLMALTAITWGLLASLARY